MENTAKKTGAFTGWLDRVFHITERGSSVAQETKAGLGAFAVAVCALLVNTQLIGNVYGNYAGPYLTVSLIAFIGTVLLGCLCNLPLLMTANMSLSTVMLSMMSANTGITYANLLAVTFLAALCYLVIVITPLKKLFVDALPSGVRKALPVGLGLYVIYTAVQNTGLMTDAGTLASAADYSNLEAFYFWLCVAGVLLLALYLGVKRKNALGSTYFMLIIAMWVCGIVFFLEYFVGGQTATTLVYQRLNLIFATDGAHPYTIGTGLASLSIGELFSQGFDFSAYTEAGGNTVLFILEGIATFVLMGMYTNLGAADGATAAASMNDFDKKQETMLLAAGAAINVLSPILGGAPVSIAPQSAMETSDGGRTGLASLTAGIGFFVALFNWIFFALTATGTHGVGMWINDTETKLAAYVQDTFLFADLMMIFIGAAMLKSIRRVDTKNTTEFVPFVITVIGMTFFGNFLVGVALGLAAWFILSLLSDRKQLSVTGILLVILVAAAAFLLLKTGGNYVTVQQIQGGFPGGPGGPGGFPGGPM